LFTISLNGEIRHPAAWQVAAKVNDLLRNTKEDYRDYILHHLKEGGSNFALPLAGSFHGSRKQPMRRRCCFVSEFYECK